MDLKVDDERVRRNILFFLHLLFLLEVTRGCYKGRVVEKKRFYPALLNCVNGEVLFPDLLPESASSLQSGWKPIVIESITSSRGRHLIWQVEKIEEALSPLAALVIHQTMDALSSLFQKACQPQAIQQRLKELTSEHMHRAFSRRKGCPLSRLCHHLTRWQAEEILSHRPYGSFLLRKGEYAPQLEEALSSAHQRMIVCYTLSVSLLRRQVRDLTIVHDGDAFLIYDDDPSLSGNRYFSLEELLNSLSSLLLYPLF